MKTVIAIIVALIIVGGGAYALVKHKDNSKTASNNSTGSSASTGAYGSSSASGGSAAKSQSPAVNNAVLITKTNSSLGSYLAEPNGTPLYTYNSDSNGVSNCSGSCLSTWPVYQDAGSTAGLPQNVSTIKRADNGEVQYTYKGLPLYTFTSDSPGQVTGNNLNGFQVARP